MLNLDDLTYKIRLDGSEVERTAAATAAQMQRLGGAVAPAHRQFSELSKNTKLTRQEMLALNYTVSDMAASLASGASPFTILLQQGGQVKDTFGGIGPLVSKVGGLITVGRVAVSGMAAAVGLLAWAYKEGADESDAFARATGRTGNAAGLTEDGFRKLTRQVAEASGATVGASREIVAGLIATGQIGSKAIGAVGAAATGMAKAYGLSAADVIKDFAGMSEGVAKWAAEHNKSMNFITVEQYRYIRSLEEQGKVQEAQIYTSKLADEANKRVTKNLGFLESAWETVKKKASEAWDTMMGIGRADTTNDQLDRVRKELEDRQARGPLNDLTRGSFEKGNERLRQEIYALQEKARLEQRSIAMQSTAAAASRAAIEKERKNEGKKDRAPRDFFNREQDQIEERMREGLDRYVESHLAALEKTRQQGLEFSQQLLDQTKAINVSMIEDDEERAKATLALEREQIDARIAALGLAADQEAAIRNRSAEYYLARERQVTEGLKSEYEKRLKENQDLGKLLNRTGLEFREGFNQEGKAAFRDWVKTGKLSTEQLTDFIRGKFADLIYDHYLSGIFDQLAQGIFGFFTGFVPGGGSGGAVSTFAAGGGVRRGSLQQVNEFGPEMLSIKGKDYLMMGADFGRVTPTGATAAAIGGGSKTQVIDASTHIGSVGAGVNPGDMRAYVRNENAKLEMRLRRLMANGMV